MGNHELEIAMLEAQTRRHFLRSLGSGMGSLFFGTSLANYAFATDYAASNDSHAVKGRLSFARDATTPLSTLPPQFSPKVRRVIYLHMAGAPSQLELYDYKPDLKRLDGQD